MPLTYDAEHQIGNGVAWSFVDPDTQERIFIDDPMMAMRLGAPPPSAQAMVPAVPEMPDQRLAALRAAPASAGGGIMRSGAPQQDQTREVADVQPSLMSEDPNALMSQDPSAMQSSAAGGDAQPVATQEMGEPPAPRDAQEIKRGFAQSMLELAAGTSPMKYVPGRAGEEARMEPVKIEYRGDPARAAALGDAYGQLAEFQADTAQQRAETELTRANQEAERAMMRSVELDVQQADLAKLRDQQKAEYDRRMGAINTELNHVTQKTVNPNRFWDDASAGTTLLTMFALTLGGIGSGINGGPNQAMQLLNSYIDRDTAKQQDEIRSAKEGVDAKRNAFQEWLNAGNDWQQTALIQKAVKLEHAAEIVKHQLATEKRQDIQLAYRDTLAAIDREKLDTLAGIEQSLGSSLTERHIPEVKAIAGGYRLKTPEELAKDAESVGKLADIATKAGLDPDKLQSDVRAFTESLAKGEGTNMLKLESGYARLDSLLQEMRAKYDGEVPGIGGVSGKFPDAVVSQDALRVRTAMREVTEMSLRNYTGAAATPEEQANREEQLARIQDLTVSADTALALYQDARKMHNDSIRGYAAGYGGKPTLDAWHAARQSIPLTSGGLDPNDPSHLDLQEPE